MARAASKISEQVVEAASASSLAVDALVARGDAILKQPLYWFPVRHHPPAIARHIAVAINARKPKIIFIEGPHEAQEMIEFLIDSKTKPPVAIYSSFRDDSAPANPSPDGK